MSLEQELKRLADAYERQGYRVVVRPGPEDLPAFARDFQVELVGWRGNGGMLASVKRTRQDVAEDGELPRYAAVTAEQLGWRYDLAVLQGEEPGARDLHGAQEIAGEEILRTAREAEDLATRYPRAALTTAWSATEAAMRLRLRALGEPANGGAGSHLFNVLYSSGLVSSAERDRLEELSRAKTRVVHGFASPGADPEAVGFLADLARRLVEESRPVQQPA